jgi:hypothetical protein
MTSGDRDNGALDMMPFGHKRKGRTSAQAIAAHRRATSTSGHDAAAAHPSDRNPTHYILRSAPK